MDGVAKFLLGAGLVIAGCSKVHDAPPLSADDAGTAVDASLPTGDAGFAAMPDASSASDASATSWPDGWRCKPGTRRWCDDAVYDDWGKQTCRPDGTWGTCIEPTVTASGLVDRPSTACACRYLYFTSECCEDQLDRDGDGHADCLIPEDHVPPVCETDGSLCAPCDAHLDCGGEMDVCLFRRDGYGLCGRFCDDVTPCPADYECTPIRTAGGGSIGQCAPISGGCPDDF